MNDGPQLSVVAGAGEARLAASGEWTIAHTEALERLVAGVLAGGSADVDLGGIERLDTFGAWSIERLVRQREARGDAIRLVNVPDRYLGILEEVRQANRRPTTAAPRHDGPLARIDELGRATVRFVVDLGGFVAMLGALAIALGRALARPRTFRLTSVVHHLDRVGWQAIGIVVLITFLIGCIIAQQGIFHFRRFGAEDYVVDLVGILVIREIGVLIVAIMVAGRSGSSYTAELGSMKMREEIDALRTMGVDPVEVLVLPRVIALVIALPILTFIGSMSALFGGELVAWFYGGMSPPIYLARLNDAVSLTDFKVGMFKAPVMALVIGVVACVEGMKVKGSAESLGLQTTASVVKSIFLVIVLDGLFAMFFASIGM
jgi:phospholipid/cholesterol/gamma-HCH transport system permease protein